MGEGKICRVPPGEILQAFFFLNRSVAKFETQYKNHPYGLREDNVRIGTCDILFQSSHLESSVILEESNEDLTLSSIIRCCLLVGTEQNQAE